MNKYWLLLVLLSLLCSTAGFSQPLLNLAPSRIVGHALNPAAPAEGLNPTNFNPNLVEGRELYGPSGLALDTSVTPPILYVSDTLNNRVLAWKNGSGFSNGAPADLVIGQPDPYTTIPGGPNSSLGFSAGLSAPSGLAVRNGDLYVVDSGNNRVLRFPQPFNNIGHQVPNLLIGQATLSTKVANYPAGKPTANGIFTCCTGSSSYEANIAFDSAGNLWLTDPGNRRVLRFPAAAVSANPATFPSADFVLGWTSPTDFVDVPTNLPVNATGAYNTNQFYIPSGIGFDDAGRLYVTDADPNFQLNRVLVFNFTTSFLSSLPQISATKIMGLPPLGTNASQSVQNQTLLVDPAGIFFIPDQAGGSDVGVLDTGSSRIFLSALRAVEGPTGGESGGTGLRPERRF